MLSEQNKVDLRRHLGFGPRGRPDAFGGSFISYRFFVTHGQFEFRIDHLGPEEELVLVGSINKTQPANPNIPLPDGTFIDGFINICNYLEGQIFTASDNLDTSRAGDWYARKDEVQARTGLYNRACRMMAEYLFVPPGYTKTRVGNLVA